MGRGQASAQHGDLAAHGVLQSGADLDMASLAVGDPRAYVVIDGAGGKR